MEEPQQGKVLFNLIMFAGHLKFTQTAGNVGVGGENANVGCLRVRYARKALLKTLANLVS